MTRFTEFAPRRALGHIAFAAVGAVAIALAAPAVAQPSAAAALSNVRDGGAAAAPAPRDRRAANADRVYCVDDTRTGSRLSRRTCKTAREWEAAGGLEGVTDR